MAIKHVGIRYSKSQRIVRCIIHLDREWRDGKWQFKQPEAVAAINEDAEWAVHQKHTHPKEALAFIERDAYHAFRSHQEIHDHLGLTGIHGVHDRCVVIDRNNTVTHVVLGDPGIDTHPAGDLISHPLAKVGDKI